MSLNNSIWCQRCWLPIQLPGAGERWGPISKVIFLKVKINKASPHLTLPGWQKSIPGEQLPQAFSSLSVSIQLEGAGLLRHLLPLLLDGCQSWEYSIRHRSFFSWANIWLLSHCFSFLFFSLFFICSQNVLPISLTLGPSIPSWHWGLLFFFSMWELGFGGMKETFACYSHIACWLLRIKHSRKPLFSWFLKNIHVWYI